jgi:hypothetical protein
MDEINLPWNFADVRDWPMPDKTGVKQSLTELIIQEEKLFPPMLMHELPLWLAHYQKIERGRWTYLIATQSQAQALFDAYQFRRDNPLIAHLPLSKDALKFGLEIGIGQNDWPYIKPNVLREKLHVFLRGIRNEAMLASIDVNYLKAIALVIVSDDEMAVRKELGVMIALTRDEIQTD